MSVPLTLRQTSIRQISIPRTEYILIQNVQNIYLVYELLNSSQTFGCVPHKN